MVLMPPEQIESMQEHAYFASAAFVCYHALSGHLQPTLSYRLRSNTLRGNYSLGSLAELRLQTLSALKDPAALDPPMRLLLHTIAGPWDDKAVLPRVTGNIHLNLREQVGPSKISMWEFLQ